MPDQEIIHAGSCRLLCECGSVLSVPHQVTRVVTECILPGSSDTRRYKNTDLEDLFKKLKLKASVHTMILLRNDKFFSVQG